MNKKVFDFICDCEGYKTAVKQFHWDSKNLSQHNLCDEIADLIADFQDQVSEVEQSMSGKLAINKLKATPYKADTLKGFVMDVIDRAQTFRKALENMGEKYVGMKSDCESFISEMQRKLYLVNFTLQEEVMRSLKEAMYKNIPDEPDAKFDKFLGQQPKRIKPRINRIYKLVHKYGLDSKKYSDENWQAIDDYKKVIESLGCDVEVKPCGNLANVDSIESDGGYCDYDGYDNMPRSKQYAIKITYSDGMRIEGYIKCMAAGTVEDPFSSYDTCIILWPKSSKVLEMTMSQLKQVISESVDNVLKEASDPVAKIQALIDQANEAYNEAKEAQGGDENPLMDKEGNSYGLSAPIRLDGRGYIVIPFTSKASWSGYEPERIRVIAKAGGRVRIIKGDMMDYGWKDAAKMLKNIVRDANTGTYHHQNYNPDWEDAETKEDYAEKKLAMRDFNKNAGLRAGTGLDTINKRY